MEEESPIPAYASNDTYESVGPHRFFFVIDRRGWRSLFGRDDVTRIAAPEDESFTQWDASPSLAGSCRHSVGGPSAGFNDRIANGYGIYTDPSSRHIDLLTVRKAIDAAVSVMNTTKGRRMTTAIWKRMTDPSRA